MSNKKKILASSQECCVCKKPAVAFWPVIDPDIPSHPYCRKCLDKVKLKFLIAIAKLDKKKK